MCQLCSIIVSFASEAIYFINYWSFYFEMLARYVKCTFDPPKNPNLSASFQQHVVEKDIQVVNFPVVLVGILDTV